MAGVLLAGLTLQSHAQVNAIDSVMNHVKGNKLSVGGYGEVGYTREFFSDNPYKYSQAAKYKKDPSHGKFDIPHAVIYLGYDFGKGWTMEQRLNLSMVAAEVPMKRSTKKAENGNTR